MAVSAVLLRPYGPRGQFAQRTADGFELLYPRLATCTALTNNVGLAAWTYPANYTQIVASTTADFYPNMIHDLVFLQPQTGGTQRVFVEVEIGTGTAGAEVVIARYSLAFGVAITTFNANDNIQIGQSTPMGPTLIPSGTRIAAHARLSVVDTAMNSSVSLYIAGHDTVAPPSDPTYPLDLHLNGAATPMLLATPTGSTLTLVSAAFPTYATPTEVWTAASCTEDRLVWGLQGYLNAGVSNGNRQVQFGVGAAASEVWYAQLGMPGRAAVGMGRYTFRRPFLVRSGERLAMKGTGINANWVVQVLYEVL